MYYTQMVMMWFEMIDGGISQYFPMRQTEPAGLNVALVHFTVLLYFTMIFSTSYQ